MGNPIFYGALLLTAANLLLRLADTGFQVYLSGQIGPAGIGLLHLIFSVRGLAFTLGLFGVRTAALYLAGERRNLLAVRQGCFRYTLLFSLPASAGLWVLAPRFAENWHGGTAAVFALRVYALFLPLSCLCAVLTACFTAAGRIKTLVAVEVLEQACAIFVTALLLLRRTAGILAVVLGNCAAVSAAFCALTLLFQAPERLTGPPPYRRIFSTALPLGAAECLRAGLNTVENLIVPQRLALWHGTADAIADYGVVCGMVFPVLMFPAAILFSLADLLVPELPRCVKGGRRVPYLVRQGLRISLLFGLAAGGLLFSAAGPLGEVLYRRPEVGIQLRFYAPFVPMLYMDAIVDAMCKGLGQQSANARYNLLTSLADVALLWALLPRLGLGGYYISFAVSHALNFALSLRRLAKVSGVHPSMGLPIRAAAGVIGAALVASMLPQWSTPVGGAAFAGYYGLLLACFWTVLRVVSREDLYWLRRLASPRP